jgi:hypothetical protein
MIGKDKEGSVKAEFHKIYTYYPGGTEENQQNLNTVSRWTDINSGSPEYEKFQRF